MKEPDFNKTKWSFVNALNFYSQNFDSESSKAWALDWVKINNPEAYQALDKVPPHLFSNRGFVCRIGSRGFELPEKTKTELFAFFKELSGFEPKKEKDEAAPQEKSDKRLVHLFENTIDDIISGDDPGSLDLSGTRKEKAALSDWVSTEYVFYSQYLEKIKKICELLETEIKPESVTRKKTTEREQISKAVKEMKYLKNFGKIASKSPSCLVGANRAVLYNTKTYTASVLLSKSGLLIDGTVIRNFDSDSFTMNTRKLDIVTNDKLIETSKVQKKPIDSGSIRMTNNVIIIKGTKSGQ